jgi:hypothetical protein
MGINPVWLGLYVDQLGAAAAEHRVVGVQTPF